MIKKYAFIGYLTLSLFFFYSCNYDKNKELPAEQTYDLNFEEVAGLKENINLLGNITSFDILSGDRFVVTTNNTPNIFIYDFNGNQVKEIHTTGKGPFEYITPAIVRVYAEKIYVWDSNSLKFIIYDKNAEAVGEITDIATAIEDFLVFQNKLILYRSGGFDEIIAVYDLESEKMEQTPFRASEEHELLSLNQCFGGITLNEGKVLFATADSPSIHSYDPDSGEFRALELQDSDFNLEHVRDAESIISNDLGKGIDYLMNNAIVTGLFTTNTSVIVKADIGRMERGENAMDVSERFQKFYVLDQNELELKGTATIPFEITTSCLYATDGKDLYHLSYSAEQDEQGYKLVKATFDDSGNSGGESLI